MSQSAWGRGRSDLGKIHITDPEFKTMALCCTASCVRHVKADTPSGLAIVDCKRCLKIHTSKKRA
jgi:hypothetical protein